jgi:uncharacterized membrane protein YbhN (UPF0104 family)
MKRIDWQKWSTLATVALTLIALGIVFDVLHKFTWVKIEASLAAIHPWQFAGAALCTATSYFILTGFDCIGIAYAGGQVPYRRIALASFLSLSIGHTVGLAPLSSGTIRYRYYTESGLDLTQIGMVILISAVTVALGESSLAGLALLTQPTLTGKLLHLAADPARLLGIACFAIPVSYMVATFTIHRELTIRGRSFRLPSPRIAAAQIALGLTNYIFVSGALYFMLLSVSTVDFQDVAAAYVLGNVASLISHVPGGIGVLEAVIVAVLPGAALIGPLIAFRLTYYLIPLAIGCLLFGGSELARRVRAPKTQLTPQPAKR